MSVNATSVFVASFLGAFSHWSPDPSDAEVTPGCMQTGDTVRER